MFNEWYHKMMQFVRDRISDISQKYKLPKYQSVFDIPDVAQCLEEIKRNFVLVSVDKAAKNVAVICKRFYMEVLLEEMESNSDTYTKKSEDCTALSLIHQSFLQTLGRMEQSRPRLTWDS